MQEMWLSKKGSSRNACKAEIDDISQFSVVGRVAKFLRLFFKEPMFFECFDHSSIIIEAESGRWPPLERVHWWLSDCIKVPNIVMCMSEYVWCLPLLGLCSNYYVFSLAGLYSSFTKGWKELTRDYNSFTMVLTKGWDRLTRDYNGFTIVLQSAGIDQQEVRMALQ